VSWVLNEEIDRDRNVRGRSRAAGSSPSELEPLIRLTLALVVIGLAVWLLLAGTAYRRQYSGTGVAWHRGANNFIEITLVREDDANLACAADATVQGLHCSFRRDRRTRQSSGAACSEDSTSAGHDDRCDAHLLRPYNTVNGELFLGAGLWDSLAQHGRLPAGRFTVNCDFEIVGALRPAALRWTRNGSFDGNDRSLAAGVLRNCAIPP
jgi:hypothetical protein